MKKAATKNVGKSIDAIMEFVDVDGVVRRINVNDVLQRIDVNGLLDRVNVDHLLDRTDVNRHIDRVDVNAVLNRVDINALLKRSDLGPLIAQSSTGVFTLLLDRIRIQIALIDQVLHSIAQCQGLGKKNWCKELPPVPSMSTATTAPPPYPKGTSNCAVALQGRASGALSRGLAWWLDNFLIALIFSIGLKLMDFMWENLIVRSSIKAYDFSLSDHYHGDDTSWILSLVFSVWWFLYHFAMVSLTGRTIGHAIFGLLVAGADGDSVKPMQVAIRTPLVPLSIASMVGILVGFVRKDRRALPDLVAGTTMVYSWNATAADLRDRELTDMERIKPMFDE